MAVILNYLYFLHSVLSCETCDKPTAEWKFHKGKHLCLFASLYRYYLKSAWSTEGIQEASLNECVNVETLLKGDE